MSSDQQLSVTVGICTRNRHASTLLAVESVLESTTAQFELLVIDQSTDTKTHDALARFEDDPRLRYIASAEQGLGRAHNLLTRQSTAEFILITDDDCTVAPGWIEAMIAVFKRYPRAAMVCCRVEAVPHDPTLGRVPVFLYEGECEITTFSVSTPLEYLGAGMGFRRAMLATIHGFDDAMGPGATFPSADDEDVGVRFLINNMSIVYTNCTHVIHDGFRSWEQSRRHMQRDLTAIAALHGKLLCCGQFHSLLILGKLASSRLVGAFANFIRTGKLSGLNQVVWIARGGYFGFRAPVNRQTMRFNLSPADQARLAFLTVDA